MYKLKLVLTVLMLCLGPSGAKAQITVPEETAPYLPIVASVDANMPEGATFDGGWKLEGAHYLPDGVNRIHIWAKPGEYKLMFSGLWLHLKDVTFKDGDGNTITITSYLGHGIIDEVSTFRVAASDPEPPGPGPSTDKQLMFFIVADDLDTLDQGQRELVTSLIVRQNLERQGHTLLLVVDNDQIKDGVPAKWSPWIKAAMNKSLPLVAWADKDGGSIQTSVLPSDYESLLELLK